MENATDTDGSCGATGGWRREEGAEGERRVRAVGSVERAGSRRCLNRASFDMTLPDSRLTRGTHSKLCNVSACVLAYLMTPRHW